MAFLSVLEKSTRRGSAVSVVAYCCLSSQLSTPQSLLRTSYIDQVMQKLSQNKLRSIFTSSSAVSGCLPCSVTIDVKSPLSRGVRPALLTPLDRSSFPTMSWLDPKRSLFRAVTRNVMGLSLNLKAAMASTSHTLSRTMRHLRQHESNVS